ncbi:hypothetical protein DPMN_009059 [Dreissena polymorpha]|uniref:Uncharacterized protein n=1 Tax=Dreissena polymorpha TaxID=45954 RepID=A0A9D4MZV5_DREPO|nr:hypothetical protein DPMN_009059 [Dreissena polymorpha]
MAEAISERELRCIRRERLREEILKEEEELKEMRIIERIERELQSEMLNVHDDQESIVSNMNTIDEYISEDSMDCIDQKISMNEKSRDCLKT